MHVVEWLVCNKVDVEIKELVVEEQVTSEAIKNLRVAKVSERHDVRIIEDSLIDLCLFKAETHVRKDLVCLSRIVTLVCKPRAPTFKVLAHGDVYLRLALVLDISWHDHQVCVPLVCQGVLAC